MALKNQIGNYLKIKNIHIMVDNNMSNVNVICELYPTEEKRWSGLTNFEKSETIVVQLSNFSFEDNISPDLNEKFLTNAYLSLKQYAGYQNWIDC